MEDPSLQRNSAALIEALGSIEKTNASIKRSTTKVVSVKDLSKERVKVKDLIENTTRHDIPAVYDALRFLEKYLKLHPHHAHGVKLMGDAKQVLENFEAMSDLFYKKCLAIEEGAVAQSKKGSKQRRGANRNVNADENDDDAPSAADEELTEKTPFLNSDASVTKAQRAANERPSTAVVQVTQRDEFERNLHQEIMEERNREVKEIAENVKDIHEIFFHINLLLGEQGEKLDVVEDNINASERATKNAADQLRQARESQDSNRRNQIIIFLIVVIVVGIVVAVMTA